ncbi:MAG TPA: hypothetical protein VIO64_10025 [Pseudobacteroides sp.]|uniref:hypothetical protein n=1 Tax=Pseudobacteroides sp. TaxID=1968840 RepID=UPI002F9501D3
MKNNLKSNWKQNILAIAVLIVLITTIIYFLKLLYEVFIGLPKEVGAPIIAAFATIVVSVITVTGGKYLEKKITVEKELREKKIPVYTDFMEFLFKILVNTREDEPLDEKEILKFMESFTKNLIIWGADDVILNWSKYRMHNQRNNTSANYLNGLLQLEKVLLAIRKDTGHKNKNLKEGDLLSLFINDIDKILKQGETASRK